MTGEAGEPSVGRNRQHGPTFRTLSRPSVTEPFSANVTAYSGTPEIWRRERETIELPRTAARSHGPRVPRVRSACADQPKVTLLKLLGLNFANLTLPPVIKQHCDTRQNNRAVGQILPRRNRRVAAHDGDHGELYSPSRKPSGFEGVVMEIRPYAPPRRT